MSEADFTVVLHCWLEGMAEEEQRQAAQAREADRQTRQLMAVARR